MNKVHVVREAFTLDSRDYKRGDEITDPKELAKVRESHARHLVPQHHELREAPKTESRSSEQPSASVFTQKSDASPKAVS